MEKINEITIYKTEDGKSEIMVHAKDGNVWLTQSEIAELFEKSPSTINEHIQNIYKENELVETETLRKFGNPEDRFVKTPNYYSLDMVISVGYRVNSKKATHFRQWATQHLNSIATKGYSLDLNALSKDPEKLKAFYLAIRKARTSEKNLYQKVKDVFKESSSDYDGNSQKAKSFFAMAQDKFYHAIMQKTAAEILLERANAQNPNMGLTTVKNEHPTQDEALIAKNYLTEDEHRALMNIAEQFMLFAETKAFRGQQMTMEELTEKLNALLRFNDYPVLYEYQAFKANKAKSHVKTEYSKFKKALPKPKRELLKITGSFSETIRRFTRVKPPKKDS